jgi:hypothetical protein
MVSSRHLLSVHRTRTTAVYCQCTAGRSRAVVRKQAASLLIVCNMPQAVSLMRKTRFRRYPVGLDVQA